MAYYRLKDGDRLKWGGDAASRLAESVINVTSAGGLNPLHVHPRNLWAVVLYLDRGDETDSHEDVAGALYIEDPRFAMAAVHNTSVRMIGIDSQPQQCQVDLKLERGNLVVFPAWLRMECGLTQALSSASLAL